ncbi:hypothetical protein CAPTEDRAFT_182891 [Capitella teleta]|uniref:Lysophospholipid acyltransferase 5 n=1 Tax=Capitella teleta TaxID=283909 RepID=R7TFA0_CAPTE|nr:hypothetical protein CAPTEDRAFT_182891 [Capitella teleta]|eukprot:ELT92172.1 hypothetical protein CAPTEDRAFT_182891 [Capitella teleta]
MEELPDLGYVERLAATLGASESALRLLISLFAGYPLAVIHRLVFYGQAPNVQHLFFTLASLAIGYFNFGWEIAHSFINIVLCHVLMRSLGGSLLCIVLAFTLNVMYLLVGYYSVDTFNVTVCWTTPQCVLTLRLTALAFNLYDGSKNEDELSAEQKETALKDVPSLLEMTGFSYFFGAFLTGPQFSFKRYMNFVNGAYSDSITGGPPRSVMPALQRLMAGVLYTLVYQVSDLIIPDSFLLSQSFADMTIITKCLVITLWGKLMLSKYVGCWLITEGVCIMAGLTYNGRDENGNCLWNGCANIHAVEFEKASTCQEYIQAFNVNTNKWMAKYIFKRLKWLGNRHISQFATLFFLALWHGLHSGYYNNFALEFFVVKFERDMALVLAPVGLIHKFRSIPALGPSIIWLVKKLYAQFALSYALVSFSLFNYDRYLKVYAEVYYVGHLFLVLLWPLLFALVLSPMIRKSSKPRDTKEAKKTE